MQAFYNRLFLTAQKDKTQYWNSLDCLTTVTLSQVAALKGAPSWGVWPSTTIE
jgi:hypothetical protein